MIDIESELQFRAAHGDRPTTRRALVQALKELGYRLGESCLSQNRHMTGDRAGSSYPAKNFDVCEIDTGRSAYNVESRRDGNFKALQAMRFDESHFYIANGCICEI